MKMRVVPFCIIIVFPAIFLATLAIPGLFQAVASLNYSEAQAKIMAVSIEPHLVHARGTGGSWLDYAVKLKYQYMVDSKHYGGQGTIVDEDKDTADKYAGTYRVGRSMVIYYDPQRPERSFLNNAERGAQLFQSLCMVVFTILWMVMGYRTWSQ